MTLEKETRSRFQFSFPDPDLYLSQDLVARVEDYDGFRKRFGNLLSLMKVKVDSIALRVLSHFYDPTYHCFTFSDYQLSQTLKEFAYIVGIPIRDKIPFIGGEKEPKSHIIGASLHVPKVKVKNSLITKGGISSFPIKYLGERASHYADMGRNDVFEEILALMIFGILIFPSFKDFVDMDAILVFMTCNPVPTLLGDVYYSSTLRPRRRVDGSVVVHLYCTSGLFHTCRSPLYTTRTISCGQKGLWLLLIRT